MERADSRGDFHSRTEQLIKDIEGIHEAQDSLKQKAWRNFGVVIRISSWVARTYAGQLMLLSSVNLIGRFCDNLYFHESLSGVDCVVPFYIGEDIDLLKRCIQVFESINPLAKAEVGKTEPTIAVSIGISTDADIVIGSDNWISYIGSDVRNAPLIDNRNPFGPFFASCLGSAETFRRLLQAMGATGVTIRNHTQGITFSVLEGHTVQFPNQNPELPRDPSIGTILLAGCGAVGIGFVSTLALMGDLHGSVTLLDDETLEKSNVSRYVTTRLKDIGNSKVHILANAFPRNTISITPHAASVESLTDSTVKTYDTIVSALDNRNNHQSRIFLQNLLPRRIIHAATQGLAVAVADIDFIHGACLGCLFYPRKEQLTLVQDPDCGGVVVKTKDGNSHPAAVSFVSAAGGILAAAEIIKLSIPELRPFSLNNYLNMSLMSPELADVRFLEKDSHCVCLCSEPFKQRSYNRRY